MYMPGTIGEEGEPMTDLRATEIAIVADDEDGAGDSAVSWAAVAAGAVAAAALTLLLMAFGAGTGLSSISPWSNSGVSATTFSVGAGIYLVVAAMLASTIGGYRAGRWRAPRRWVSGWGLREGAARGGARGSHHRDRLGCVGRIVATRS